MWLQGVLHLDLKPDNILLHAGTGKGLCAVISDFGCVGVPQSLVQSCFLTALCTSACRLGRPRELYSRCPDLRGTLPYM